MVTSHSVDVAGQLQDNEWRERSLANLTFQHLKYFHLLTFVFSSHFYRPEFDSLLLNQYAVCFACLKEGSKSTSETSLTLSSLTANDLWQNTVLLLHSSYTFTSILIDNPPPSSALKYFSKIFHLSNHLITVFHFVMMGKSTDDHFYFPCTFKACSKEPLLVPRPVNYNLCLSVMKTLYVLDRQNGEETQMQKELKNMSWSSRFIITTFVSSSDKDIDIDKEDLPIR